MAELPTVATLWIGERLSWFEQLSLKSFVDAGHETLLYTYQPMENVPTGVVLRDAREVFPGDEIIRHKRTGSPAIHADLWRLHLMQQTDYIWVDSDVLCVRPFDFDTPFVFGIEKPGVVCNAVMRLPSDSATLAGLMDFIADPYAIGPWLKRPQRAELEAAKAAGQPVHFSEQAWGLTGPAALTHYLKESGEWDHALPQDAFYPVPFPERNKIIRTHGQIEQNFLTAQTYAVHLWARRMKPRLAEQENNRPRPGSYLAKALTRHGIDPAAAPILLKASASSDTDGDD